MEKSVNEIVNELVEILHNGDKKSAELAIEELSKIFGEEATNALINALGNRFWTIRKKAADILKIRGREVAEAIAKATTTDNPDIVFWSMRIIGELHTPNSKPVLLENLESEDSTRRGWAAEALGNFSDSVVITALIKHFIDDSWPVRKKSAQSLVKIGEDAVPYLEKARESDNNDIKYWTDRTLDNIQAIRERLVTIYG